MFSLEGSVTPYLTFGRLVSMCVHIFFFIFYFFGIRARVCLSTCYFLALVGTFPRFLSLFRGRFRPHKSRWKIT